MTLNWPAPGGALTLTESSSGVTPAITISETSSSSNLLEINLGSGFSFNSTSTTGVTGLTYQNAGSPGTSQYATINIAVANNLSSLAATLPGDGLTLGPIYDSAGGLDSISTSAATIAVAGISTASVNGNVALAASGNLTVNSNAAVQTGTGTISLAADVNANGTGYNGAGVLTIGAGATVTSANPSATAMIGRWALFGSASVRIAWVARKPSITGICTSMSTTSKSCWPKASNASVTMLNRTDWEMGFSRHSAPTSWQHFGRLHRSAAVSMSMK